MTESDSRTEIMERLDSGKQVSSGDVVRLLAENDRLLADATARDFELDALAKENWRLAEMLAKGVFIESATLPPDRYDIRTRGTGAMLLAEQLVLFFKSSGGENFTTSTIEMEFADPKERERYALTIQKLDGVDSPSQKIYRQVRRIAELEKETSTYREEICGQAEIIRRLDEEIEYLRDTTAPKVTLENSGAVMGEIKVLRHLHEKDASRIAELEEQVDYLVSGNESIMELHNASNDRVAELEGALEPLCIEIDPQLEDRDLIPVYVQAGDVRKARAALAAGEEKDAPEEVIGNAPPPRPGDCP